MAGVYNYEWHQGADLTISLIYKSGPPGNTLPVDLTGYSLRMDIVAPDGKSLAVLNDKALDDTNPYVEGDQDPDTNYEVSLGADGSIVILLSRALTLPGGKFYPYITGNPGNRQFNYDMFLRNPEGLQTKIIGGTITIFKSVTQWH